MSLINISALWATSWSRRRAPSSFGITILMPPSDPTLLWTTFQGSNRSYVPGASPPFAGNLAVTNVINTDSAITFLTTLNALISDSSVIASTPNLAGTFQLQGMVCRATLQNAFKALINGYRFDMNAGTLRLFRSDAQILTLISSNFVGGYYAGGQPVDLHMASTPTQIACFASATGQTTTPTILGTGVDVAPYPTGRIGLLDFSNPAGEVLGGWNKYQILSRKEN